MAARAAEHGSARPESISHVAQALLFLVVLAAATALSLFAMWLAPLSTAACSSTCDYDTLERAIKTYYFVALVPVVLAVCGIVLLRRRGWWVVAAPLAGLALLAIAFFTASSIARAAMHLPA